MKVKKNIKKLKLNKEIIIDLKSKSKILGKGTKANGCGTFCHACAEFY